MAFRLRAPVAVQSIGDFTLSDDGLSLQSLNLYKVVSPWQPDPAAYYTDRDARFASGIARRLLSALDPKYGRVAQAIALFWQITMGQYLAFPGAYLALYAVLEHLFVPDKTKATTLANRASSFLSGFTAPATWCIQQWLRQDYDHGRSKLAHGDIRDVNPWQPGLDPDKEKRLGRLHEICRLCILGFISLPDHELQTIGRATGTRLQKQIEQLAPATGRFLKHQRMWCD
jgi:hypothetical protein